MFEKNVENYWVESEISAEQRKIEKKTTSRVEDVKRISESKEKQVRKE